MKMLLAALVVDKAGGPISGIYQAEARGVAQGDREL